MDLARQDATFRCDHCGREAVVSPMPSPYLFDVVCPCGFAYRLAWTTRNPPPTWTPPAGQLRLEWEG